MSGGKTAVELKVHRSTGTVFTPTETVIVEMLSDGKPHPYSEVMKCLGDELAAGSLATHVYNLRKKLRPFGGDVLCVKQGGVMCYQRIVLYVRDPSRPDHVSV